MCWLCCRCLHILPIPLVAQFEESLLSASMEALAVDADDDGSAMDADDDGTDFLLKDDGNDLDLRYGVRHVGVNDEGRARSQGEGLADHVAWCWSGFAAVPLPSISYEPLPLHAIAHSARKLAVRATLV